MPLSDTCPHCRTPHRLDNDLDGRLIRCKSCGEPFRVGGGRPVDDDDPRPRRRDRSESSALVPLLIVGGVLGVIGISGGGVLLWYLARSSRARPPVMTVQKQMVKPPAMGVIPDHILPPPRPAGALGAPAEPAEGPETVTLSNPRRAEGIAPGQPTFQVDYEFPGGAPAPNEWHYLVAKVPGGFSETLLHRVRGQPQGTLAFRFFPGHDPGQGFEVWIERRPPGKPNERSRVSKVVTIN